MVDGDDGVIAAFFSEGVEVWKQIDGPEMGLGIVAEGDKWVRRGDTLGIRFWAENPATCGRLPGTVLADVFLRGGILKRCGEEYQTKGRETLSENVIVKEIRVEEPED